MPIALGIGISLVFGGVSISTPAAPTNSVAPVISGAVYVGQVLSSTTGTWSGSPSYAYQWKRGGSSIGGATSSTYSVTVSDEGQNIMCDVTATNAGGSTVASSNTLRHFIPTDLGAALSAWFDASDSSTITLNGSTVSEWRDKSSAVRHISQASAANQPTYNATGFNSKPAVVFDGSSDYLFRTSSFMYTQGSATILGAFSGPNGSLDRYYIAEGYTAITAPIYGMVDFLSSTDYLGAFLRTNSNAPIFPSGNTTLISSVFVGTPVIAGITDTSTELTGYRNGNSGSTLSYTRSGTVSLDRFTVGALLRATPGTYAPLTAGDLVISTALSSTNRAKLEGYFAHKWGLTANLVAGHPYITTVPTP